MNKFAALLLPLLLLACGSGDSPPLAGAKMGGPFSLTNQDGKTVSERDFAGRYRLVYFGYTFCPDVCPLDVLAISKAMKAFEAADGARAQKVAPIFITVDPKRDSPKALKEFLGNFHTRFVGLTGSEAQIAKVEHDYGAYAQAQKPDAHGSYRVDHSRNAVLYGPQGQPLAILTVEKPDIMATELAKWVK